MATCAGDVFSLDNVTFDAATTYSCQLNISGVLSDPSPPQFLNGKIITLWSRIENKKENCTILIPKFILSPQEQRQGTSF